MDFDTLAERKTALGTASPIIVIDSPADMVKSSLPPDAIHIKMNPVENVHPVSEEEPGGWSGAFPHRMIKGTVTIYRH